MIQPRSKQINLHITKTIHYFTKTLLSNSHSVFSLNTLLALSAKTLVEPGRCSADIYILLSIAHSQIDFAISWQWIDRVPPLLLIYVTAVVLSDLILMWAFSSLLKNFLDRIQLILEEQLMLLTNYEYGYKNLLTIKFFIALYFMHLFINFWNFIQ